MNLPKINDVAEKAGVSVTTVSLVLNGKGNISKEVRNKIFAVAQELGYRKNIYASSMGKKQYSHVAILVSEDYEKAWEWNFIRQMIIQLEARITPENYYPVIIPISIKLKTKDILTKILSSGTGALFSIHYTNKELFTQLEDLNIPVIILNNSNLQNKFCTVCADDFQGAYDGTSYLLKLNHRHIAYAEYNRPDMPDYLVDCFFGFKKAISEYNGIFTEANKITVDLFDTAGLEKTLKNLLSRNKNITGIYAIDDYFAARIYVALKKLSIRIPEDISLIGIGDALDYSEPFVPQITTISLDTGLMGKIAGDMMLDRLKNKTDVLQVLKIKEQLIERGSCKKL
jgi:LacI family transcriptional regulator